MRPVVKRPITIKLVTLYIIDRYKTAIPESALSTIMLDDIDVNYFDYRQALAELEEKNCVYTFYENDIEYHLLTVDGKEIIDETHKKIAYQLREEISGFIKKEKKKILKGKEFQCEIVPINDVDYSVKVTYNEADQEIMSITFQAGGRATAEAICRSIRSKKDLFYGEINMAISKTLDEAAKTTEEANSPAKE